VIAPSFQIFRLLPLTALLLLAAPCAKAVTEITFTHMPKDEVQVETSTGEKRIYKDAWAEPGDRTDAWAHPGNPNAPDSSHVAPLRPVDPQRHPSSSGKVLSTPLLPIEERVEFTPLEYEGRHDDNDLLMPQAADTRPIAIPAMGTNEHLEAELKRTRAELAKVSRLLRTPIILDLKGGDKILLQWADARQQISVPRNGVVKIQLAPK
jgi:hypothetical protein